MALGGWRAVGGARWVAVGGWRSVGGGRWVAVGGWRSVGGARQVAFGCWCRILKARNAYIIYQFHHRIRAGIRRQILGNSVVYKPMTSLCFATAHAQSTPSTPTPPAIVRQPTSTSVRTGVSGTLLHCVSSTTRAVRSCSGSRTASVSIGAGPRAARLATLSLRRLRRFQYVCLCCGVMLCKKHTCM